MAQISPERRERLMREKKDNASGYAGHFSFKNLTKAQIRLAPLQPTEPIGTKMVYYFINNKSYICNEDTHGKPGVIAATRRALVKLGTEEALELAEAIKGERKTRYLMKIIDRAEPDKILWAEAPKSIYEPIYKVFDEDGEDIAHPLEGRDIRISKTGSGLNTEYSARILDQCPLHEDKEVRRTIKQTAYEMSVDEKLKTDEAKTLEALKGIIPKPIWAKIAADVVKGIPGLEDDAPAGDDEDTPKPRRRPAVADDGDEDAPKAPAAAVDDEDAPAPKPKAKPAPALGDDDEDAPAPKPKPKPPVDDEDAPAPKPKPKAPVDDEDTPAPKPKPKPKPPVDDEDAPPAPKAKPAADDDEDAPAPPPKPSAAVPPKRKFQVNDDE